MSIQSIYLAPQSVQSKLFSLSIQPTINNTIIVMKLLISTVNTCDLPGTYAILKKLLPSIYRSECFNQAKLSFAREVRRTEIGHLFEHILLEYLCQEKIASGFRKVSFEGVTNWNWIEEPPGTFHITINAGYEDASIFAAALKKSMELTQKIIQTRYYTLVN